MLKKYKIFIYIINCLCRNFGLLSFGEEAEEDEVETNEFVQKNAGKAKSLHDVVDDPKLSKEPINVKTERMDIDESNTEPGDYNVVIKEEIVDEEEAAERRQRIKDKLKSKSKTKISLTTNQIKIENSDSEEDLLLTHEQEKKKQSEKKK